jgi:hypothetical protein
MQRAISVNAQNPDVAFNVEELNRLMAEGWKVVNGFASTMQAVLIILEKEEPPA